MFSHPNVAGAFLALAGVLALYLAIAWPGWPRTALAVLFPVGMAISLSADSAIAYTTGVIVVLAATSARSMLIRSLVAITLLVVAGAILPFLDLSSKLQHAFSNLSLTTRVPNSQNSLQWRFNNWHLLIDIWKQRPWFGWGLGSTDSFIQPLNNPPHSEYVRSLVETGIIGAILMTVLIVSMIRYFFARGRFTAAARAIVVATLCDALAANTLSYTPMMFYFAAIVGASIAFAKQPAPAPRNDIRRRRHRRPALTALSRAA
jgi:O-antigen ligase